MTIVLRDMLESDFGSVVALNDADVILTSPMDFQRLNALSSLACHRKVVEVDGSIAGFLLAMKTGCGYQNVNFEWFSERCPMFLYVDRVVIGGAYRGRGLGRLMYDDLFAAARYAGIPSVTCEYNVVPPNDASQAFHDRLGFREVGRQWLSGGTKQVSMQAASVSPD